MHGPPKRYSPMAPAPRRLACVWLGLALVGCASTAPTPRGEVKGAAAAPGELAQSDANRMATLCCALHGDTWAPYWQHRLN